MELYKMFRRHFREFPKIKDFFDRLQEHNVIVQPLSDGNQRILVERKCFLYGSHTFLRFLCNFNNPQLLYMNKNIFKTTSKKQNKSTDIKISKKI